jgi:hypothetical protein
MTQKDDLIQVALDRVQLLLRIGVASEKLEWYWFSAKENLV